MPQLDENLKALDVQLSSEHLATLDKASRPTLNWPAEALANIGTFGYCGTKINGETFPVNPRATQKRWRALLDRWFITPTKKGV